MKKLISLITILSFLMQVIPFEVKAQPVYDDVFDSGDIFSADSSDFYYFDASNAFTRVASGIGLGPFSVSFDTNGDLIGVAAQYVICVSKSSNYTALCAPYDMSNFPASAVYDTGLTTSGFLGVGNDQFNNFWAASYSATLDQVARVYKLSTGYFTSQTLTIAGGEHYIVGLAVDMLGDIWVIKNNVTATDALTKVYCLDHENSYAPCSGGSFDVNGAIDVTYGELTDIAVNSQNDIILTSGLNGTQRIIKLDRDTYFGSTFTQSDVSVSTLNANFYYPWSVSVDSNDRILVVGFNDPDGLHGGVNDNDKDYAFGCFNGDDLGTTGDAFANSMKCGDTSYYDVIVSSGLDVSGKIIVDNTDRLWVPDNSDGQYLCYTPSTDDGPTFTPFAHCSTYTHALTGAMAGFQNRGDGSGFLINRLMDANAGQDQAQVTATVDPVISFEIRNAADNAALVNNTCSLGTLSASSTSTCEYRLAIETNATSGFTVYYDANGGLISGSDEIDAVGESTVSTGVEEYGVAFSDATGNVSPQGNFTSDDSSVPNASTLVVASTGPYDYQVGSLGTSTLVTHKASISTVTPAGSYSQVVTITVTGNF